jgi:excisionase family DNA binding protein
MNTQMAEETKESRWITVKEIAKELEVTPSWVYELCETGEIPNFKIKSKYFIERKAFYDYLEAKKKG